jgi:hypothetical protein
MRTATSPPTASIPTIVQKPAAAERGVDFKKEPAEKYSLFGGFYIWKPGVSLCASSDEILQNFTKCNCSQWSIAVPCGISPYRPQSVVGLQEEGRFPLQGRIRK